MVATDLDHATPPKSVVSHLPHWHLQELAAQTITPPIAPRKKLERPSFPILLRVCVAGVSFFGLRCVFNTLPTG